MKIGINCINIDPQYKGGVNTFTFRILDGFLLNKSHDFPFKFTYQIKINNYLINIKKNRTLKSLFIQVFFLLLRKY